MRRPERELKDQDTIDAILSQASVGRMATVNRGGIPVIKPVNFIYWDRKIYIHSSMKGEKIEDIHRGSPVCFEIDEPIAYLGTRQSACQVSYYYRSIIIKGEATFVREKDKKIEILERMMKKYQPEEDYGEIPLEILEKTAVIEIRINEITAKENLG
ncbi:MAG: pyridoxamine 5'-phosphate oxidase family protein [Syntrophaceae bacterium]|nr:pyridoxamine 5'-phosphate oxidase family protein [Syntrophaceae bacterium]